MEEMGLAFARTDYFNLRESNHAQEKSLSTSSQQGMHVYAHGALPNFLPYYSPDKKDIEELRPFDLQPSPP
jgi:hypothetical protein